MVKKDPAARAILLGLATGLGLFFSTNSHAAGTWAPLAHAPPAGLNNSLLMSDGTVIAGDGGQHWYKLTPDSHGSYVNGTWTTLTASAYTRLFYSSDVLTNGNVYVAGGEYGTGTYIAELYNTAHDSWFTIGQTPNMTHISDAVSKILPNGSVLQGSTGGACWIYNVTSNSWQTAPSARNQNEACWVKMPNDAILTVDNFGQQAEHYVPSLNAWVQDPNTPQDLYGFGGELGPAFVLPNGNVFCIGASVHTATYTPGATANVGGSWVSGPDMIFGTNTLGGVDAPGVMMVNGKILCCIGPTNGFNGPTSFFEYDYTTNGFTQVNGPTGLTLSSAPFVMTYLALPDGNVLFISGQGSKNLYVYTPDGTPLAQGQPTISNITQNADGSYHLTGTNLNGITGGAAYGDDWQMDSNYPLVRMTNLLTGVVYYARTFGWTSTGVQNTNLVSTEFTLPVNLPAGTYSLVAVANGNSSDPVTFTNTPPPAPTGFTATSGNAQISLAWDPVPGAISYNLKRLNTNGSPYYALLVNQTGTNYLDTGLTNAWAYYYTVTAVTSDGISPTVQTTATPVGPPPVPGNFVAYPSDTQQITVSWSSSFAATTYHVKRSTTNGGPYTTVASPTTASYVDTNVTIGTTYYYVVSATNANVTTIPAESPNTSQASAVPDVQTVLVDFNTAGQYASNFNQWNDSGGTNGGNYDYLESAGVGVGGSRGISVYRSTDTTATYKTGSWNFGTTGATVIMSTMIKANNSNSGDKIQFGITSSNANGLNNNTPLAWESYRFVPVSNAVWSLREQYRDNNSLTENTLSNVTVIPGHWYKMVVSLTNTSGSSGNFNAGCAFFDYGTNGLTPGSNIIAFNANTNHTSLDIATNFLVWPALRAYQDAGIDAWDNFVVYKTNSKPIITFPLTNTTITYGTVGTFTVLAEGPGKLTYQWRTNGVPVGGATASTYSTPSVNGSYSNITVFVNNNNGSTTNTATITILGAPPAGPSNLLAMAGNAQVGLIWNASATATNYNVKRSLTDGGPYAVIGSTAATNYSDTGLTNSTTYYYVVSAVNIYAESTNSAQVSATPVAPTPVLLSASAQPTNGQFTLQFAGSDGESYVIETSSNLMDWTPIFTNTQSNGMFTFTDTNTSDPARFYRVKE